MLKNVTEIGTKKCRRNKERRTKHQKHYNCILENVTEIETKKCQRNKKKLKSKVKNTIIVFQKMSLN